MPRSARKKRNRASASARPPAIGAVQALASDLSPVAEPVLAPKPAFASEPAPASEPALAPAPAPELVPEQALARAAPRRSLWPHWLWALGAVPLLPPLTAWAWSWPDPQDAFLAAYACCLALGAPAGALLALRSRRSGDFELLAGAGRGALAAVPAACLLLWACALASLARAPEPFGGEVVQLECGPLSCEAGLYDHRADRFVSFRMRPERAPATTGATRHLCLRPAWPQPVLAAWEDPRSGCSLPEPSEAAQPRP